MFFPPKKKLDLGNLRDTWGRSQPFLEHATASTAICESLTALRGDHVGQLRGLGWPWRYEINNQYFKVLQSTSKYFKVLQPSFEMVNMVNEWLLVALVTATSKVDGIGPKEPAHAVSPNGGHQ